MRLYLALAAKEGKQEEFERRADELMQDRPTGSRSVHADRSDADPLEYWIAGLFVSREAYAPIVGVNPGGL